MSDSGRPTRSTRRAEPEPPAVRKRHRTATKGVFWRGTDKDRRYEIAWRCYATCGRASCKGQHWARTRGGYQDAIKVLTLRREAVEQMRARRERGEDIAPPSTRTFSQVTDEYLASRAFRQLAPGTQKKYREAFRLRAIPKFGDRLITKITTDDLADWLDELRTAERQRRDGDRTHGLSESTVNAALTAARVVFKFAASRSRRYIAATPVAALEEHERPSPQADKRPVQVLDERELAQLFEAAPDPDRMMLEVKAGTGLRSAELRALFWSDIDLNDRKRITVSRQIDTDDEGRREAIKDRALTEFRYVPLTDALMDRLFAYRAERERYDLAGPGDFVFGDGRHVKHAVLAGAFGAAVDAAGIARDPDMRLSPHSLRHGYGSLLLAHGEQVSNVSAWLGHRKISTTERWYAHQIQTLLDVAADRMRERERERLALRS